MKLVTITGCLGFIGSYITRACLDRGWKVFGIDKMTYAANPDLLKEFNQNPNFTFRRADIAKIKTLPECDYVINLAAESHVGNSIINSDDFISSNVVGTKNLLDIIRHKPENTDSRPHLIHFSTDEVYGDIISGAHTETDLLHPSNPYSAAKAAADMLVIAWSRTYGITYNIIRPTNNYGKFQYHEKLIPICVRNLSRGKEIRLHDEGEPYRNWLHAADTASAVLTIIDKGNNNEIYNISGIFEQKNKDTVRKVITSYFSDKTNWKKYVNLGYVRQGQDVRYSVDDSKLRDLGWVPIRIFDDEIDDIVQFYKDNFRW
jgi:dTDP-glucose 4,6-dehydratase